MCAKMRRGALNEALLEQGIHKVALGHHYDDAVETFLMSLLYEGRISCFQPVTLPGPDGRDADPTHALSAGADGGALWPSSWTCRWCTIPARRTSTRSARRSRSSSRDLQATYPDLKTKLFGAMQRLPLPAWEADVYHRQKQRRKKQQSGGV